jgi:hypothetical protein
MTHFNTASSAFTPKSDSAFDDLSASLGDPRPHPTEDALIQLGRALMTELVDVISDTALEDYQTIIGEALIGAFHSAAGRIERDADRARDTMRSLDRDFDGSEAADTELQDATAKARAGDAATQACELIRDAASETWTVATGEVWTAWRGSRRGTHLTAAQLEAKQAIRAIRNRKSGEADPGGPVVAFRGAPTADTAEDAGRIFDALNWAKSEWPDMALATTGAKGSEKLAIKWAQQKGVKLILARADFDTHGKAAPFRANDELIALEPEVCLTLVHSVDRGQGRAATVRTGAQPRTEGDGVRAAACAHQGARGLTIRTWTQRPARLRPGGFLFVIRGIVRRGRRLQQRGRSVQARRLLEFAGVWSDALMAMSGNLQKEGEGKIKGGFWRGLFFVFCPWVSGLIRGIG